MFATMRSLYNEIRRTCRLQGEARAAYLEGVIDALRTMLNRPRSPYQPEAYGENLRQWYEDGFSTR